MNISRIKVLGADAVYHCIGRIVGGGMLLGEPEKEAMRKLLWRQAEFCGVEVITYCLMTNHVHLLIRVPEVGEIPDEVLVERVCRYYGKREPWVQVLAEGFARTGSLSASIRKTLRARMGDVSVFMKEFKQRFSKWYNRRHERFGTLWAERFKSLLVEESDEAIRTVAMYIDLNPVRAGLVSDPKDYRFCGHAEAVAGSRVIRRETCRYHEGASWKKACAEYRLTMMCYGAESRRSNQRAVDRETLARTVRDGGELKTGELLRLRIRYLTDGLVLGSPEFVERVFREYRDRFGPRRKTGGRRMRGVGTAAGNLVTARDLHVDAVS